jgi:hypothetical protein
MTLYRGKFARFTIAAPALLATACLTDNPTPRYPPPPEPEEKPRAEPVDVGPPRVEKTCQAARPATDGLIDDLEDGDTRAAPLSGRGGYWWIAKADHAVVSTPPGDFAASDGGPDGSKKTVRFAGKSDQRDQWGAAVGLGFLESGFYDASKYAGVMFKIKAHKPNLNVRVKLPDVNTHPDGGACTTGCWNSFGKELIVGTEWQVETLLWSDLAQQPDWGSPRPPAITPSKIKNIEWAVYQGIEFDFMVDDVQFIECV